jgi:type II secretory pathway pseudopilin PulG
VQPARPSGGFLLMELLVASAVLGVAYLILVPLLSQVRLRQQELERRSLALTELGNLAERVGRLAGHGPLNRLTAAELPLSEEGRRRLPGVELTVNVRPMPPAVDAQIELSGDEVTLAVSWIDPSGARVRPVSVTMWWPTRGASGVSTRPTADFEVGTDTRTETDAGRAADRSEDQP